MDKQKYKASIEGCIVGTAVGDALGLPWEGISRAKQSRIAPDLNQHYFCFGYGMCSDDTEHTCMLAQALIESGGEKKKFQNSLARKFRYWLLSAPAGIGFATLRSILKLWLGYSPEKSGVFSAGNGPAMRSALLGVCYGHSPEKLVSLVKASTYITHKDPKAELGALAVALAAHHSFSCDSITPSSYLYLCELYSSYYSSESWQEFRELLEKVVKSVDEKENTFDFLSFLGQEKGVGGYIYHTLPVVLHVWLRFPLDYQKGVKEIISLGGDTDTTAAILGGIIGSRVGREGISLTWQKKIIEWPRSISWMRKLSERLANVLTTNTPQKSLALFWGGIFPRNVFFVFCICIHVLKRFFFTFLHLFSTSKNNFS